MRIVSIILLLSLSACSSFHLEGGASVSWGEGVKVQKSTNSSVEIQTEKKEGALF